MSKYRKRDIREFFERETGCEIPDGYEIHHIDGDRNNNSIENLRAIPSDFHKFIHGKMFDTKEEYNSYWWGNNKGRYKRYREEYANRDYVKNKSNARVSEWQKKQVTNGLKKKPVRQDDGSVRFEWIDVSLYTKTNEVYKRYYVYMKGVE